MEDPRPIKRALVSVSDKEGIVEFVKALKERSIEILSTGGTAALLKQNGIDVIEVSDYTLFPEMMDGRLKTLHPLIHGGILGRQGIDDEVMQEHGIKRIDLVCVNLYPFVKTVMDPDCTLDRAIENIDIGGPAMLRAAAKNYHDVAVVVKSSHYEKIIAEMDQNEGSLTLATRFDLAAAAFEHTAAYDSAIANYLGGLAPDYGIRQSSAKPLFPRTLNLNYVKIQDLRYGENPHQRASFYRELNPRTNGIATAQQLQGKELSYNNIADTDTAVECVREFQKPCCIIVKHANPCGAALADNISDAYLKAFEADSESAFGGIIAFNRPLDGKTVELITQKQFCEVIAAPKVTDEAKEKAAAKKNVRLLEIGDFLNNAPRLDLNKVTGGILVQEADIYSPSLDDLKVVTEKRPSDDELDELLFAFRICKYAKSNAIVLSKDKRTIGIGCGQTSRVFAVENAFLRAEKANLETSGCVLASDAFFPFRDSIDAAAKAGISCIIQPGGSIRDEEVIKAANEHNIAMVFTGMRHFRH